MKIRFEYNIDRVIECVQEPNYSTALFHMPESTGKAFLFMDKVTGAKQVVVCVEAATEEKGSPNLSFLYIPPNAVILQDEEKEEYSNNEIMKVIQDCHTNVCEALIAHDEKITKLIETGFDSLRVEGCSSEGISEKTFLEALRIVTKSKEE